MEAYRRYGPKVGRNDLCPCGSGRKFKRCHYSPRFNLPFLVHQAQLDKRIQETATRLLEEKRAEEIQREIQQGRGRPIISIEFQGYRFVAVRNRLYYSKTWKTFTDFLDDYLKSILGSDWGNAETRKPSEERHPIIQWYYHVCLWQQKHCKAPGAIYSAPITGAVSAYYGLAYNLYLIAHNVRDIQTRLVHRLRDRSNFHGALYETRVASELVKAGFELEFENEADRSRTHCEFTATFPQTKRKFSVEAKSRPVVHDSIEGKRLRIGRQLIGALEKQADFDRVVFIDINRSIGTTKEDAMRVFDRAVKIVKRSERIVVSGKQAPTAYVILTNFPDQYSLDNSSFFSAVAFLGYKIPDFGEGSTFPSVREAVRARERHIEVYELKKSIAEHALLPSTFDGKMPSSVFGSSERLRIGQRYLVPNSDGAQVVGILEDAAVLTNERQAYGIYKLEDGKRVIITCPLTAEELEDYQRYPDTFFGVYKKVPKRTDDPVDLFYFFHNVYKDSPRECLLEFIKDAPDYQDFEKLSQHDLAEAICERWVYSAMREGPHPTT